MAEHTPKHYIIQQKTKGWFILNVTSTKTCLQLYSLETDT